MCGTTGSYVDMLNKGTWLVDCVVSLSKVMSSHEFSIAKSCMMLIVMCSFTMRQTQQEPNIFEGFCENHPDRFVNSINIWILEFIINWLPWGRQVQAHPLEREGASPVGCFPQWFSPRVHPSCRHPNHMATSARFVRIETTDQQGLLVLFPFDLLEDITCGKLKAGWSSQHRVYTEEIYWALQNWTSNLNCAGLGVERGTGEKMIRSWANRAISCSWVGWDQN